MSQFKTLASPDRWPSPYGRLETGLARGLIKAGNLLLAILAAIRWPVRPRRPTRIGVFRVGNIGDVLVAVPALAALRDRFPGAEITLISSPGKRGLPGAQELLEEGPLVDKLTIYHAEDIQSIRGRLHLVKLLRARRFDALFVLPPEMTSFSAELRNLGALACVGARWARGFSVNNGRNLPLGLSGAYFQSEERAPEWRRLLSVVVDGEQVTSEFALDLDVGLHVDDPIKANVDRVLAASPLGGRPLLSISPGAQLEHKKWSPRQFGEVAKAWIAAGGTVCGLGGPGDHPIVDEVSAAAGGGVLNLCGSTTLLESAEVLRRSTALVANDTGTMHLCATVGTPVVAVFSGSNREGIWAPWIGAPSVSLRESVGCSPCFHAPCPHQVPCLSRIRSEQVITALQSLGVWPGRSLP